MKALLLVPRDLAYVTELAKPSMCLYFKKAHVGFHGAKQYANTMQAMLA